MNRSLFRPGADALLKPVLLRTSRFSAFRCGSLPAFLLALAALAAVPLHAQSANSLFKRGESAEAREDYDAAFDLYQKAQAKAPKDLAIRTALARVRVSAFSRASDQGPQAGPGRRRAGRACRVSSRRRDRPRQRGRAAGDRQTAPQARRSRALRAPRPAFRKSPARAQELDSMGAPVGLKPISNEPLTLHYTEDAKVIYQAIGKAAGINVLFDPDYTSKRIQVDLTNFPCSTRCALSAPCPTPSGVRSRRTPSSSRRTPAPSAPSSTSRPSRPSICPTPGSRTTSTTCRPPCATCWRQHLRSTACQPERHRRARNARRAAAGQKLINDLDKARAEVVVDIAVLEVSKNWERTLGIAWPTSIGIALKPPTSSTSSSSTTSSTTGTTTLQPTICPSITWPTSRPRILPSPLARPRPTCCSPTRTPRFCRIPASAPPTRKKPP